MKRNAVLFFILILCQSLVYAQQKAPKYKDIIVLLNARQFELAEIPLKRFLKENTDKPSAYLFMGIIYFEKVAKEDVIRDTELIMQHADSAILNLETAAKGIDDRELRRNSEYYESYNRRNLRTGDFGVELSDVKLDIEKKVKSLKERKSNVRKLKDYYVATQNHYAKSIEFYKTLKADLPETKFYLLSDSKTIENLKTLMLLNDSTLAAFENYKAINKLIGKTGYNQIIYPTPIKSFAKDGLSNTDFSKDDLDLWDYKTWAKSVIETIEKEIEPMRAELIKTDVHLNQLLEKLKKDSVSVFGKLDVISNILENRLKKYDEDPLPLSIFNLKLSELRYGSVLMTDKPFKDTSDIKLKLDILKKELKEAEILDSAASNLAARNIEEESKNYNAFIANAYGTPSVVKSLAEALKDYATTEIERKHKEIEIKAKSLDWLTTKTDSIPLFIDATVAKKAHKMLLIKQNQYTSGLKFGVDSVATGYLYTITPSRVPDISVTFPVDKVNFAKNKLPLVKALSADDGKGQIYFSLIYSEEKLKDKFPVTVAKIYRSDGLAWSNNYLIDTLPSEVMYIPETAELSIKLTNSLGESKLIAIDKLGKLK